MKKIMLILAGCAIALTVNAKDIRVAVLQPSPALHCAKCETKIKGNMKFEKGVRKIRVDVPGQRVYVEYDHEKNTAEALAVSMKKYGYTTKVVTDSVMPERRP